MGYKIQNYVAGKYTRARAPLARKYTNRIQTYKVEELTFGTSTDKTIFESARSIRNIIC